MPPSPKRSWAVGIKIFEIFEGTSEIQRLVIARHVLGA
jgi:alkylation response protein AidB-like acyl-CoA dehydrogenase